MGQALYDYYLKAESIGGLPAKMLFAGMTRVASTQAKLMTDTPELIAVFDKCLVKLKSDLNLTSSSGEKNESSLFKAKTGEDSTAIIKRLRNNISIYLDLMSQRSLFIGNLQQTFERITEASVDALDCERVSVWFYDEAKTQIECKDLYVRSEKKHYEGVVLKEADFPNYFDTIKNSRTLAAHDAHHDSGTSEFSEVYLKPLGINSLLDVPIYFNGDMVGVVCHEHVGPKRNWLEDEENYAFLMANFVSLALELKA